ncbi:MAG: signal peptidase I [Oscillospiraceae bacterium]|jgi:signal peptidase I|nr:signal peptidase I [Oscillospiraceae bacterium]
MRVVNEFWVPLRLQNNERSVGRALALCYDLAGSLVLVGIVLAAFMSFGVKPTMVDGVSMEPALRDRQTLVIAAWPRRVRHGDIVVVADTGTSLGEPIVKRVIGLPGDKINIDFQAGVVYRNGEALDEPYAAAPTDIRYDVVFPLEVPPGRCFLLGDNRAHSEDSRSSRVGLVDLREIEGVVIGKGK